MDALLPHIRECGSKDCCMGSTIGYMFKIDRATSKHSRKKFARICVKIDLTKKLDPHISIMRSKSNIEYEELYQICLSFEKYGHRSESCYKNLETKRQLTKSTSVMMKTPMKGIPLLGKVTKWKE
ncbi:hypothetical protein Ahy_A08g040780 [Arachis hypogaea]|uniref:Uncharacterized protein n=1 Tax=Arachis hypogaea TaxID=3818 RepID=A0A445C0B6_ARAHY|nr:hypothetical protein Ahy_A08g040780 [Arachis hypogaea]